MMPTGGAAARSEKIAALNVVCHGVLADPAVADLLDEAEGDRANLDEWQHANLAEMRRQWAHATALNPGLVEALSKAASACEQTWRKARPAGDFAMVKPALAELLARVRESAAAKAERLGCSPYDALLDEYEPAGRSAEIDVVFDDLAKFLPTFRERVLAHQAARPAPVKPAGPFPIEKQRALGEKLMHTLGFDFEHGRLDISLHPFCGGVPDDVRITTRYYDDDFAHSLMAVIHETGHALYERGLPPDWRHQPVGQARGMSLHESQSLLMEMQACRSRPFGAFVVPLARATFGGNGPAWDEENVHRLYTRVKPDFIRVDADEVTYPAHVILRYGIEKALFRNELQLADVPGVWREEFKKLLGLEIQSDREGCLQDMHWYDGAFGYFPCYSLGAMTAAQLFDAACKAHPGIPGEIEQGKFSTLQGWLRANVHSLGSSLTTPEIVTHATGRPLDVGVFKKHLERRYLS